MSQREREREREYLAQAVRNIFLQNEIFKAYRARPKRVNNKERTEINSEDVMDILHFIWIGRTVIYVVTFSLSHFYCLYLCNWSFSIVDLTVLGGRGRVLARQECLEILTTPSCLLYSMQGCRVPALHWDWHCSTSTALQTTLGTWDCSWSVRERKSRVETIFIFLAVKYEAGWEKERWGEMSGWGFQVGLSLEPLLAQHAARPGPDWEVLRSGDFNFQLNWKLLGLLSQRDNDTALHRQQTIASLSI